MTITWVTFFGNTTAFSFMNQLMHNMGFPSQRKVDLNNCECLLKVFCCREKRFLQYSVWFNICRYVFHMSMSFPPSPWHGRRSPPGRRYSSWPWGSCSWPKKLLTAYQLNKLLTFPCQFLGTSMPNQGVKCMVLHISVYVQLRVIYKIWMSNKIDYINSSQLAGKFPQLIHF